MKFRHWVVLLFLTFTGMGIYQYCQPFEIEKMKVVYVNSYHPGHPSSDEIMESVLGSFPAGQVTGMLEILPLGELLELTRSYYPGMSDLLILTENTTTSRKQQQMLDTLFDRLDLNVSYEMINDFDTWKTIFKEANDAYDAIYIPTNGAILGWDHDEAVSHVKKYIKVPLLTCEDFMMPYVVLGVTKVASEHGSWSAGTAKKILQGTSPEDIPVTRNQQSVTWLNSTLADQIGFNPDSMLVSKAKMVGE